MSEWQPIESAPKEARMLLLLCPAHADDYHTSVHVGFWGDRWAGNSYHEGNAWLDWHAGLNEDDEWVMIINPSHWMPLPPPPAKA